MIIEFIVKNWKSFRDETKLSFVAGNKAKNERKIPVVNSYNLSLLPLAAVYGGNASGKSNLIEALKFAQQLIVNGKGNEIVAEPFFKDNQSESNPCSFNFKLLIDEVFYVYKFSVSLSGITEEKLSQIEFDGTEKFLFERDGSVFKPGIEKFHTELWGYTKDEHLVLSNAMSMNIKSLLPVYNWFNHSLQIIQPNFQFKNLLNAIEENEGLLEKLNEVLYYFDTGILEIENQKLAPEVANTLETRQENFPDKSIVLNSNNGKTQVNRLVSKYQKPNGKIINFPLQLESEGSKRLIDLLPTFFNLTSNSNLSVLVIDEIDRSLHSHLTKSLITAFLGTTEKYSRTQLLFTTHDLSILDPKILRSDETWVTDRNREGVTHLHSFGDYKNLTEQDVFEKYELGVLGGVPNILYKNGVANPFLENTED